MGEVGDAGGDAANHSHSWNDVGARVFVYAALRCELLCKSHDDYRSCELGSSNVHYLLGPPECRVWFVFVPP